MNDYILQKYANNIRRAKNSLSILPKDHTRKESVSKKWHVCFWYYRVGEKKKRMFSRSSVYVNGAEIQINREKTDHEYKVDLIQKCKDSVIHALETDPSFILGLLYGEEKGSLLYPSAYGLVKPKEESKEKIISIENALNEVLKSKEESKLTNTYINDLKSIKDRFLRYLGENSKDSTKLLSKQIVVKFLNEVSAKRSNRTYNNNKTNLKTLLEGLENLEYIDRNFLDGVKNKQTKAKRNHPFTEKQIKDILRISKDQDYLVYFYFLHVYYSIMRPQTISRLRVKDIDMVNRTFKIDAKTGQYIRVIGDVLHNEYKKLDLENSNPEHYIFGRHGLILDWAIKDENRREAYSDRFSKIKNQVSKDQNHTIYSGRHSAVVRAYKNLCDKYKKENVLDWKSQSIEQIRIFLDHKTKEDTKKYLRGISVDMHEDIGKYL